VQLLVQREIVLTEFSPGIHPTLLLLHSQTAKGSIFALA
jgi:hypothetical protein